jgi:hypothetical protein
MIPANGFFFKPKATGLRLCRMNTGGGSSILNEWERAVPPLKKLTYQNLSFVHPPSQQVAKGYGFYYFLKGRDRIIRKRMFKGLPQ